MRIWNRRATLAVAAGAIALVVWGMIFWAWVYEPFGIFEKLPVDAQIAELLSANDTQTGVYFFPWPRNTPEMFAAFVEQHRRGPFFQLSYMAEGVDPQSPGKLLLGVAQYVAVALLAVALVQLAAALTFARRFGVVLIAGLIGTIFVRLGDPIWFHLPWQHTLGHAAYEVIAWLLLALVIAAVARPGWAER